MLYLYTSRSLRGLPHGPAGADTNHKSVLNLVVSQIKSAATHFISYKVRASRQFIQNLKVITTKISYFRQTTAIARDTNYINHAQIRYVSLINRSPSGAFM